MMRGILLIAAITYCVAGNAASSEREIYPPADRAEADIAAALKTATDENKRVILDFGGNWCTSCRVLDINVHNATNKPILDAHFVLVHVNVGNLDRNVDIASRYEIPLKEGVPALVLLNMRGKLLTRQTTAEAIAMEHLKAEGVTRLLNQWSARCFAPLTQCHAGPAQGT
jgi:thiol:disulfide interchange protein